MALYSVVDKHNIRPEVEGETPETCMDADSSKAKSLPTVSFSESIVSTTVKGAQSIQQCTGCFIAVAVALAVLAIIISLACLCALLASQLNFNNGGNVSTIEGVSAMQRVFANQFTDIAINLSAITANLTMLEQVNNNKQETVDTVLAEFTEIRNELNRLQDFIERAYIHPPVLLCLSPPPQAIM